MKKIMLGASLLGTLMFASSVSATMEEQNYCAEIYQPVCGVDQISYGNACMAGSVEIAYSGECEQAAEDSFEQEDPFVTVSNKLSVRLKNKLDRALGVYEKKLMKIPAENRSAANEKVATHIIDLLTKNLVAIEGDENLVPKNEKLHDILTYLYFAVADLDS